MAAQKSASSSKSTSFQKTKGREKKPKVVTPSPSAVKAAMPVNIDFEAVRNRFNDLTWDYVWQRLRPDSDTLTLMAMMNSAHWIYDIPIVFLQSGGVSFMIVYFVISFLLAFPLMFLQMLIGQLSQKGPLHAWRSYGIAYTGFGICVIAYSIVQHIGAVFEIGIFTKHLFHAMREGYDTVTDCTTMLKPGDRNKSNCYALFEHGGGRLSSSELYHTGYVQKGYFEINQFSCKTCENPLFLGYFLLCMLLITVPIRYLRFMLAGLALLTMVLLPVTAIAGAASTSSFANLTIYEDSRMWDLVSLEVWQVAMLEAMSSQKLIFYGVLSMSSYRNKYSNVFKTAVYCYIYGLLGVLVALFIPNELFEMPQHVYGHFIESLSSFNETDRITAISTVKIPEVYVMHGIADVRLLLFNLLYFLLLFTSLFGGVITMKATVRDFGVRRKRIIRVVVYAVLIILVVFVIRPDPIVYIGTVSTGSIAIAVSCFYMLAVLMTTVILYGKINVLLDLSKIYTEPVGWRRYFTAFSPLISFMLVHAAPFIALYGFLNRVASLISAAIEHFESQKNWSMSCLFLLLLVVPVVYMIVNCVIWKIAVHQAAKDDLEVESPFLPMVEHHKNLPIVYEPEPPQPSSVWGLPSF